MSSKCLYVIEDGQKPDYTLSQGTVTAEIGRHIRFNPEALNTFDVKGCEPLHYDVLLLCAAIEFADRRWIRPRDWRRTLNIVVPVIDLKTWQKPEILKSLHSALNYLTGDTWRFTFTEAQNHSPIGSRQIPLGFETKTFVVAYSDGLDSRAVSALGGGPEQALCIRVARNRQHHRNGDNYFTQIPFKVKSFRSNESSFRSRGFQFAAVTTIAAQLSGVSRIVVPESGQGALGPALLPLHNIYPDYRNHPTFFRKMEQFIEALLGHQVRFEQPRLWFTKGQTLQAFLSMAGKSPQYLTSTRSCWQTRRIVNVGRKRKQCGLCAACLLRRLSLHAAGVDEATDTYVVSNLATSERGDALSAIPQKADRDIMIEYGSVGARHLQHLAEMSGLPDDDLRVHASQIAAATGEAYEEALIKLRTMLLVHAEEWRAFLFAQGEESFLKSWMDGGRHG